MSDILVAEPETYASLEIRKLRAMHEAALDFRLGIKKKMREIILHWKNLRISQFFAKWKLLLRKTTYYEKIKLRWIAHIRKRRINQMNAVQLGKVRFEKNKYMVANMMRNEIQLNAMEKRSKEVCEMRAKSAQVNDIRQLFKRRQSTPRKFCNQRQTRSAIHDRTRSVY